VKPGTQMVADHYGIDSAEAVLNEYGPLETHRRHRYRSATGC
jgi:hypothetical protein